MVRTIKQSMAAIGLERRRRVEARSDRRAAHRQHRRIGANAVAFRLAALAANNLGSNDFHAGHVGR